MSTPAPNPLDALIAEYLVQVESGEVPDRGKLLAEHPKLAEPLTKFFADLDRLDREAADLRMSRDPNKTVDHLNPLLEPPPARLMVRYVGDFELLEELAHGGMGVVYKARQVTLNRIVALKMILKGAFASRDEQTRFHSEAEAAATLDHPHIVPIYEVGTHEGQPYFAMRYLEGGDLGKLLQGDVRSEAQRMFHIADAVHHAHQRGILHRDLKPGNIMLDAQKQPHVTDFGLAKKLDTQRSLTETGRIVGTPKYMAPEQAAGKKGLTVAADVYSLGVILYERLTGATPFQAATALELLRQVRENPAPRLSTIVKGFDRDLETITLKCLEKEPTHRYHGADELRDELQRWLEGRPILARPVGKGEQLWRWVKRNPVIAGLAAGIAAVLLLTTLTSLALSNWALNERDRADRQAGEAQTARDEAQRQQKEAVASAVENRRLYDKSLIERGYQHELKGDLLKAMQWYVEPLRAPHPDPEAEKTHKERLGRYLKHANLPKLIHLFPQRGYTQGAAGACWSPDGKTVLIFHDDKTIRLYDAATGQVKHALTHEHPVDKAKFNSSGTCIVTTCGDEKQGQVILWNPVTGAMEKKFPQDNRILDASVSADGKKVGVVIGNTDKSTAMLLDAGTGTTTILETGTATIRGPLTSDCQFTPNGEYLCLYEMYRPNIRIYNSQTKSMIRELDTESGIYNVTISSDSRLISASLQNNQAKVWGLNDGKLLCTADHVLSSTDFSPDSQLLATASYDHTARVLHIGSGKQVCKLERDGDVNCVHFSPDGMRLATASESGAVNVWNALTGERMMPPIQHSEAVLFARFSPDGYSLLTELGSSELGMEFGAVRIWNIMGKGDAEISVNMKEENRTTVYSENGKYVLKWKNEKEAAEVVKYDSATGAVLNRKTLPGCAIRSMKLSGNDSWLVIKHTNLRNGFFVSVDVLESATFRPAVQQLRFDMVYSNDVHVSFSENGDHMILEANDNEDKSSRITVYQLEAGEFTLVKTLEGKYAVSEALMAKKNDAIILNKKTYSRPYFAEIIGLGKPEPGRIIRHGDTINSFHFSRNGQSVATASVDRTARIWDLSVGKPATASLVHDKSVSHAAFTNQDLYVKTTTYVQGRYRDSNRYWEIKTGLPISPESFRTKAEESVLLSGLDWPIADIESLLVVLQSGVPLDSAESAVSRDEQIQELLRLKNIYPDWFETKQEERAVWHRRRAYDFLHLFKPRNRGDEWQTEILEQAIRYHLEAANRIQPDHVEYYYVLGLLHDKKPKYAKALPCYRKALELGGEAYLNPWIASLYDNLGLGEEVAQAVEADSLLAAPLKLKARLLCKLHIENVKDLMRRSQENQERHRPPAAHALALRQAMRAIVLGSTPDSSPYRVLAGAQMRMGQFAEARESYDKAAEQDRLYSPFTFDKRVLTPDQRNVVSDLGLLLSSPLLLPATHAAQINPDTAAGLALCCWHLGDHAQARRWLQTARRVGDPKEHELLKEACEIIPAK